MSDAVLVAVITGGFGFLGICVTVLASRMKATNKAVHATQEQVQNSHKTNLRDDLDRLHDDVRLVLTTQEQHGKEIGGIRTDLAHERDERLDVARRLDAHIAAAAA